MKRQGHNKKKIIGLTGSFGSGKSTVAAILKAHGAQILDADKLAHACIAPGSPDYKKIINVFGRGILRRNGTINRRRLSKAVFNDMILLEKLNNIIHPAVIRTIKNLIRISRQKIIILDVPLLIESGLGKLADKIIVVKASRAKQIERIQEKRALAKLEILKRLNCQLPLEKKIQLADFIIDNNGTINNTKRQVKRIFEKLK